MDEKGKACQSHGPHAQAAQSPFKYPGDTGEESSAERWRRKELKARAIVSLGLSWATWALPQNSPSPPKHSIIDLKTETVNLKLKSYGGFRKDSLVPKAVNTEHMDSILVQFASLETASEADGSSFICGARGTN